MTVKKHEHGTYTYQYLKQQGYEHFYQLGNNFVASKEELERRVVVQEDVKIPEWKVVMNFQLYGTLQTKREERRVYNAIELPKSRAICCRFYLCEIV